MTERLGSVAVLTIQSVSYVAAGVFALAMVRKGMLVEPGKVAQEIG